LRREAGAGAVSISGKERYVEREEERHMQTQINALAREVAALSAENNMYQDILDAMHEGFEKIADKVGGRMDTLQVEVTSLKVQFARVMGYAAGMAAVAVSLIEIAKAFLVKH
jgi:FtsZ-binding cell division protein ZapB